MGTIEWTILTIAGFLAGAGLGFWFGKMGRQDDVERIAEIETELNTYREKVTEHFGQSAAHFQAIGRQYRELYEHMAAGSEKLCEPSASEALRRFPRPDEVVIERASLQTDEPSVEEHEPVDHVAEDGVEISADDERPGEAAAATTVESPEKTESLEPGESAATDETSEKADGETSESPATDPDSDPDPRIYH